MRMMMMMMMIVVVAVIVNLTYVVPVMYSLTVCDTEAVLEAALFDDDDDDVCMADANTSLVASFDSLSPKQKRIIIFLRT